MSGGDKLDFEIRPNPAPVSAADRAALLANPGFGRVFTDHMVTVRYADGKGWYDARVEARAPDPDGPGQRGAALRAGDLRGAEGVPHGRRWRDDVPAGRQRGPLRHLRAADGDAGAAAGGVRRLAAQAHRDRPGVDPHRRGRQPLPAAVHVRQRGLPRRPPGQRVPLHGDRLTGRGVLHRWRQAGHRLGLPGLHPGRARWHRRGQVRRQLRRVAGGPGGGHRGRLRPGRLPGRGGAPVRRRAGRHERLLRLRRRHGGHPAADRHDPAGHHPRRRSSRWPARPGTRSRSGRSASPTGRPTPPAAAFARCSPAAPPRWSPRSVGSASRTASS